MDYLYIGQAPLPDTESYLKSVQLNDCNVALRPINMDPNLGLIKSKHGSSRCQNCGRPLAPAVIFMKR